MQTSTNVWYLVHFFLELKGFQTNVTEKIEKHIRYSIPPPPHRAVFELMWKKYSRSGQDTWQELEFALHTG